MDTVLITGCSTGIGHATAARLAARRLDRVRDRPPAETLADLEAAGCRTLALDVTDEASMRAAVDAVEGGVDVLVNNAGYSPVRRARDAADGRRPAPVRDQRLRALRMCQLVLPGMRAAGEGTIVNVSSMGGRLTFPGGGAYHATKYAVEAMSDALRMEVGRFGIDVICVEPGLIRTEFSTTAVGRRGDGRRAVRGVQRRRRALHARRLRRPAVAARRRRRRRRGARSSARCASAARRRACPVTPSARLIMGLRRVLPDRAWDRVVGSAFR